MSPSIFRAALLVSISLLSACGGTRPVVQSVPDAPARAETDQEILGVALEALLAIRYCEPDLCVDPFPIAGISRWARHGDRVAFAGVGALIGVYEGGEWHIEPTPSGAAVYDVGFAPDGTLFAVGELDGFYVREGASWRALLPLLEGEDRYDEGALTAVLPLAANEVWLATSLGVVSRWNGQALDEVGQEDHAVDRLWSLAPDRIAAAGLYSTTIYEGTERTLVTTAAQNTRYETASGCVEYDEEYGDDDGEDEETAPVEENLAPRFPTAEPSPAWPDRTMSGWIDLLDADRSARFRPWLDTPPTNVTDVARDGERWIAVGRDEAGVVRFWSRMGELAQGSLGVIDAALVPAASLSGGVAFVASGDRLVRLDAAARAAPELARTVSIGGDGALVDVLALSTEDAFVLTATGDVLRVSDGVAAFAYRAGRALRALGGAADDLYAVGPAGAVVHFDGTAWTSIASGSTVDLFALHVPVSGAAYVAGAAGAVLAIERGAVRALPRAGFASVVEVSLVDGAVLALTDQGELMRWDGTAWSRRDRGLRRAGILEAMQWTPETAGAWQSLAASTGPALDEPGAVVPYGASPSWFRDRTRFDVPETEGITAPSYLEDGLEFVEGCCDGGPTGSEDWTQIEWRSSCADDPTYHPCVLEPEDDFGIDEASGSALRLVDARPATDARASVPGCIPLRIEAIRIRDGRVLRTSPTFECTGEGTLARDTAAWAHLADESYEAFQPWGSTGAYERGPTPASRGGTLFVHRTASEDALVFVDDDNRVATPIFALPRRGSASEAWGAIDYWSVSPSGAFTVLSTTLAEEHFVWIGATPIKLGMRPADAPPPGDIATCTELLVHDDDGATQLRAQPRSASPTLGALVNGTRLHVESRRGGWIRVSAGATGWVYRDNVRCAAH